MIYYPCIKHGGYGVIICTCFGYQDVVLGYSLQIRVNLFQVEKMIGDVRSATIKSVDGFKWMDGQTKVHAKYKVRTHFLECL